MPLVTLSGAHSIGHVHPEVSGFGHPETAKMTTAQLNANPTLNAWDETPDRLDSKYFESLIVWVFHLLYNLINIIILLALDQCPEKCCRQKGQLLD